MGILFIGNSSAARECYWLLHLAREADPTIPIFKGFLSWQGFPGSLKNLARFDLGDASEHTPDRDDQYVIATGFPELRNSIYLWIKKNNLQLFTLKHPDVWICPDSRIGEGNIFNRGCAIQPNVKIGNANYFNGGNSIAHDVYIGNCNVFNLHAAVCGNARIGDKNLVSPSTVFLQNCRVGSENIFAPGAVIYKGCGNGSYMAGNPALIERKVKC